MSFVRNARIMLVGFALAQALPLLASPLLTRLFSPAAFGLQTLFISWATVLGVIATLRLDLAVVLSANQRQATQIVSIATAQTAVVAALALSAAATSAPAIATATGHAELDLWIWLLAPMVVAMAAVQTSSGLLTWLKRFGPTSQAQVVNQVAYLATAIFLGFWAAPTEGLVLAKLVGQVFAAAMLLFVLRAVLTNLRLPPREDWSGLLDRCRPFVMFNTPYSLVGVLGREVPIFAFSAIGAAATAGFYGLARTLLGAPATLLAASLSQVFYREAAELRGSVRLQTLTIRLLRVTMGAPAPAVAFLIVWGDAAFSLAFGPGWETAGVYAMILAFPAWLGIQTAWPERLYESVGRQGVSFAIQITFDALTALAVFGSVFAGVPSIVTVAIFATANSLFHFTYLTGMFRVAGFPGKLLARTMLEGLLILGLAVAVMTALRYSGAPPTVALILAAALAAVVSGVLALVGYHAFRATVSDNH